MAREGIRLTSFYAAPSSTIPAGRLSADMGSELDLFPTLVHVAGGRIPDDRHGWIRSHAAAARAGSFTAARTVLLPWCGFRSVTHGRVDAASRRAGGTRALTATPPTPELYDLDRDPGERFNVAKDYPDVATRLRARLEAFEASLR
jgi:arylsulfatase A-like enzyme